MPINDRKGPSENQSPIAKRRPTQGANPTIPQDELDFNLIGGFKHSATGGSSDEYSDKQDECTRGARENYGTEAPEYPEERNFEE